MKKTEVIEKIKAHPELLELFSVRSLSVFGSVTRNATAHSRDVDILVEFEPGAPIGLFEFISLKESLSELLGEPVDLATPDALHPALKDEILREALHVI
jgi:predicted nucleotidyltransferase